MFIRSEEDPQTCEFVEHPNSRDSDHGAKDENICKIWSAIVQHRSISSFWTKIVNLTLSPSRGSILELAAEFAARFHNVANVVDHAASCDQDDRVGPDSNIAYSDASLEFGFKHIRTGVRRSVWKCVGPVSEIV